MRRVFRWLFLVVLGVIVGVIAYEGILMLRVYWLRTSNPSSTSLIDARAREARARGQQPRREQVWVPLQRISPNLQRAVLAGEDTNFLTHRGFDYEAIQKAFEQAQREAAREAKREGENDDWLPNLPEFKRGGSTISQQLAKNLYLSSQRSFVRKGQEALVTIMLERLLTKRRILEIYLNVIEWGDGIYGAEAASQRYFRKPASALNASEAAYLSAMIPNPRTVFNPQVNPRRVARRQRIILRGMPYVKLP
ncbi:MAG TPA: transglycosylase domain-containing protein [Pyrinomonadaceae bacterium]|nr:transglycosylase domain-containing protein [Pyrinomonadaceae bacterium]